MQKPIALSLFALSALALAGLAPGPVGRTETTPAAAMGADCTGTEGQVQALAKITNTRDRNYHCLGVKVDARGGVAAIRFETHHIDPKPAPTVRVREFPLDRIASAGGVVLDGARGHDAVILEGEPTPDAPDADFIVKYLHNGLTGEYRSCPLRLERTADGAWRLLDARGHGTRSVVVEARKAPLIGAIGIETIRGVC